MKYTPDNPLKILFVCFANMCRSPMAEAIIVKHLGEAVRAESAGIAVTGHAPPEEAIELVRLLYGIDISRHRPRNISEVDLSRFDFILAMDTSIFMNLHDRDSVPKNKLFAWDIEDPCGRGAAAYRQAARKIEERIGQFLRNRDVEAHSPSNSPFKIKS